MPSLAYSILKFHGADDLNKMIDFAVNEDKEMDFNVIEPIPEGLDIHPAPYQDAAIASYYNTLDDDEKKKLVDDLTGNDFVDIDEILSGAIAQEQEQILAAEERIDLGEKYYGNLTEFGVPDAYEWTKINWGMKGYAMDTVIDEDKSEIQFTTAGKGVRALMYKLYEKSGIPFVYRYTDNKFNEYGEIVFSENGITENEVDAAWVDEIFDAE
ncbi:hypothetical protein [Salinicoccus halodurans]|uniref:YubB ferredoxin-like domain-containing protein n=1 Tax=Salinicoccus halodurans TaxID=407035 RepID=A0A0F7D3N7_9STAP|nr:hypothetical protein [Salinicoccus halodurans]AKG72805.1 hypothetical protein AAT16_00355 [Salinicoccus halodurans]SFK74404.1 hypothetical protein SAMN05216235_1435 [Salinicoccus halodurans]